MFEINQLPEIHSIKEQNVEHPEKDEAPTSLESGVAEELAHDDEVHSEKEAGEVTEYSEKLTRDEFAKLAAPHIEEETKPTLPTDAYDIFQPQLKSQIQDLIKKQKEEYLDTVNVLKKRFFTEQQLLLQRLQTSVQNMTSTPLQNVSIAPTEDEEFTEFQTCLQSINLGTDLTLTSDLDAQERAATIINAYTRGYLTRRLFRTVYVKQCISNIQGTLQVIITLDRDKQRTPQDFIVQTKLFQELQGDLYRFHDVFFKLSTREQMKLISSDRERHFKKQELSNGSFHGI